MDIDTELNRLISEEGEVLYLNCMEGYTAAEVAGQTAEHRVEYSVTCQGKVEGSQRQSELQGRQLRDYHERRNRTSAEITFRRTGCQTRGSMRF